MGDFSSVALWEPINKPSLINISVAAIFSVLKLENSSKSVEVLRVDQDLSLINVIVVLTDADQFKLKTIWLMDYRRPVCVVHVVIGLHSSMILCPVLLPCEELSRSRPRLEFDVLLHILSKVLRDKAVVFTSIISVKKS